MSLFTVEERERLRARVLEWAATDDRVVAGAVVGSLALGDGDRWSDLDLTFAVADGTPVTAVLGDWSDALAREFGAVQLFDVTSGAFLYRVFLVPGCLQFDLSFAPAAGFGAAAPTFRLLFGAAAETAHAEPPPARELFGQAVHHALRARFSIERSRLWQAVYWIGEVRNCALALACRRRGLPARYGRGVDDLPAEVAAPFEDALVTSLERAELVRALEAAVAGLLREADEVRELADRVESELRTLTSAWAPPRGLDSL